MQQVKSYCILLPLAENKSSGRASIFSETVLQYEYENSLTEYTSMVLLKTPKDFQTLTFNFKARLRGN